MDTIKQPQTAESQSGSQGIKNVVLVHGAFADGSSWEKVIRLLLNGGLNVTAVQNPLTSLEDDVAAAKRAIALMDGPVLLVGHSWAGMVISEAGNDPKVAGLLYVCALVPDNDQTVEDVTKPFPPAPGNFEFRQDSSGFLSLSFKGMTEHFALDLPPEDRKVLFATQVPWAAISTTQKVSNPAWKTKPSWYIVGTNDLIINPELQRTVARMINATTIELNSGHIPMVSDPDKVATFIIRAAEKLSPMSTAAS
ncbi:alpha/beta hydrolase [Flavihumibacter sp. R14]|nr:alpha/beta hydrolase [Flavihumibacter soli]